MKTVDGRRGNFGIRAQTVNAGAVAVGDGATATTAVHGQIDTAALTSALAALQAALADDGLPAPAREPLHAEAAAIATEAAKPEPDRAALEARLRGLVEKVTLVRELASGAAGLIEPVRRIAAALGLGALAAGLF